METTMGRFMRCADVGNSAPRPDVIPRARVRAVLLALGLLVGCSGGSEITQAPVCEIRSGSACPSSETQVGCWGDPSQALLETAMHGSAECREPAGSDGSVWCCVPAGQP